MPIGWAIAVVVLWLAVVTMAVIVLGALRQVTSALERVATAPAHHGLFSPPGQGPQVGEPVPPFSCADTAGAVVDDQVLRGQPALLLFLHLGCSPCESLVAEMRGSDLSRLTDQLVVITDHRGPADLGIPAGIRAVAQAAEEVSGPLGVTGWPYAVALDPTGLVRATGVPNTVAHLEDLAAILA
jgi:methylamine dehydrogenase accessory protein MauD